MESIVQVGEFLAESFTRLWSALGTWGIFGLGVIAPAIIKRISNLVKKVFEF